MKRNEIVVDATAIVAALDPDDAEHVAMRSTLTHLIARSAANELLLVSHTEAVTGAMTELARRGVPQHIVDSVTRLAAAFDVEVLHRDLFDDAESVQETARANGVELDLRAAFTVEVARRRKTRRVLSLDQRLDAIDLERVV